MQYLIFDYLSVMILPLIMFIVSLFGKTFAKSKINSIAGYRTKMSKLNRDTWETANTHFAKMWFKVSLLMLGISMVCGILIFFVNEKIEGFVPIVIMLLQLFVIVVSPFKTENMLMKTFDEKGNRRENNN